MLASPLSDKTSTKQTVNEEEDTESFDAVHWSLFDFSYP